MNLENKPLAEIGEDLDRIATEYGPCDLVLADIDAGLPHERVGAVIDLCKRLDH